MTISHRSTKALPYPYKPSQARHAIRNSRTQISKYTTAKSRHNEPRTARTYKPPNISQFSSSSGPPPLTTFLKPCVVRRKAALRSQARQGKQGFEMRGVANRRCGVRPVAGTPPLPSPKRADEVVAARLGLEIIFGLLAAASSAAVCDHRHGLLAAAGRDPFLRDQGDVETVGLAVEGRVDGAHPRLPETAQSLWGNAPADGFERSCKTEPPPIGALAWVASSPGSTEKSEGGKANPGPRSDSRAN